MSSTKTRENHNVQAQNKKALKEPISQHKCTSTTIPTQGIHRKQSKEI